MARTNGRQRQGILDRVPPYDDEAERGVLGSILLGPQVLDDILPIIQAEHFYDLGHGSLFDAMRDVYQNGGRLDVLLLKNRMQEAGNWEKVGGAAKIAELAQAVPNHAHAVYYARIVRDKALLRMLVRISEDSLFDALNAEGQQPADVLEAAERRMTQLSLWRTMSRRQPRPVRDLLREAVDRIDARQRGDFEGGVASGFCQLDQKTGGWKRQNLIVVGGRPGHGKTALGLQLARTAASGGLPVMLFSLEMSQEELAERLLAQATSIDSYRLRNDLRFTPEERRLIVEHASQLSLLPLIVQDEPNRSITTIASECRRQARTNEALGLVIIDYLQLITPETESGVKESRQEQVAKMSRRLKQLAKELDVPIIILAQVNRESAKYQHAPRLHELRESGAIEQDADMVVFVYRSEFEQRANADADDATTRRNPTELARIVLAKNRMGPTGGFDVQFHLATAMFHPMASNRQQRAIDETEWMDFPD